MYLRSFSRLATAASLLVSTASATRLIESSALVECMSNSSFTASLFNIVFTPDNHTLVIDVVGDSSIAGNVSFVVTAAAYGYQFLSETVDPCTTGLDSLCPLQQIEIAIDTQYTNISANVIGSIPGIAYGVPDLDATVTVYMHTVENPKVQLACARTSLSNGKTVHQAGVSWATAVIFFVGLLASGLLAGFGHLNTASHLAVYSLSLFHYFQAVAIVGLTAVPLPPMVQSWTQDFQWTMGIIRVGFLQTLATWYLIATGGVPAQVLATLGTKSVQVFKRALGHVGTFLGLNRRAAASVPAGEYIVRGVKRVAFRANMEATNLFLTGLIFFSILVIFTLIIVTAFKWFCVWAVRAKWMKSNRFEELRRDYRVVLKGVVFRLLLIGYPGVSILCLWEFTRDDSPAEIVLAVAFFIGMTIALILAGFKVISVAKRSEKQHQTPAYMLYANPITLNKWGFLYIQYRATAYWYIVPTFVYILIKAMFVAFGQGSGTVQAIALVVIEALALISASVWRPWMDKPSNVINVSITVVNFLNAIFLLIFTGIFNGPGLLIGVTGVVFFILNAAFALVLLIFILVVCAISFIKKNPDARYIPASDNRASFMKSQTALTNELNELGTAARGEPDLAFEYKDSYPGDADSSLHSEKQHRRNDSYHQPLDSPVQANVPFLQNSPRHSMVSAMSQDRRSGLNSARAPSPIDNGDLVDQRTYSGLRQAGNNTFVPPPLYSSPDILTFSSPWQRGAGYDH